MRYIIPHTVDEALNQLCGTEKIKCIAGGTDLAIILADTREYPDVLVDITLINELRGIEKKDNGVQIGAATTLCSIASSDILPETLTKGAASIGSPQIRNLGTIGGNICNASPCGDTLTPVIALNGTLKLVSKSKERLIKAEDFFTGPKKSVLRDDEILTSVFIKNKYLNEFSSFKKIGKRNGQSISQVNAALWIEFDNSKNKIRDIRAAAGSVAPVPLKLKETEEFLKNKSLTDTVIEEVLNIIEKEIKPISDVRAEQDYRKMISRSLFYDLFKEALYEY